MNLTSRYARFPWCRVRCLSHRAEKYPPVVQSNNAGAASTTTFRSLGIRPAIAAAMQAAFPNVKFPTESQKKFIPAVINGYDVLLKDGTGTGKSFGLVIALLNKPRAQALSIVSGKVVKRPAITSLVIVPHRDLAYQLHHWISRMASSSSAFSPQPLSSICQVLVRDSTTPLTSRISMLREDPPHVLIGTPQAFLELLKTDREALQLESLSAVVADEVDYLIQSVPRKKGSEKMMEKARRKLDRHPSATRQLLDVIYASRVISRQSVADHEPASQGKTSNLPQLIMSSATLRNHLKLWLYNESGWLKKSKLEKVMCSRNDQSWGRASNPAGGLLRGDKKPGGRNESGIEARGGNGVTHYMLVVAGSGNTANIEGAVREEEPGNSEEIVSTEDKGAITPATVFNSQEASDGPGIDEKLTEKFGSTRSPLNAATLEAIATVFALDVPNLGLVVLPADGAVHRVIYDLRTLGVDARELDLRRNEGAHGGAENPSLLVGTLATSRGLDLPELTHVFLLGMLEGRAVDGRAVDSYLHVAGRVGRFGRSGKVISVVDQDGEERMRRIIARAGIEPDSIRV